jgi:hypothetical protein
MLEWDFYGSKHPMCPVTVRSKAWSLSAYGQVTFESRLDRGKARVQSRSAHGQHSLPESIQLQIHSSTAQCQCRQCGYCCWHTATGYWLSLYWELSLRLTVILPFIEFPFSSSPLWISGILLLQELASEGTTEYWEILSVIWQCQRKATARYIN